jgi:digeranylgeranylglycerophospholipid reductase
VYLNIYDYDLIVAGGGLAGLIAASSAAYYSNQVLRILVVDRNPIPILGRKTITGWICGDAVGKKSVDYMTERIGIKWGHPEIEHPVKGVMAYSPNHEAAVSFDGEGYILNRRILPQKQLRDAQKLGVEIRGNIALRSVLVEDDKVVGVEGQDLQTNESFKKTSKLVVDASGVTSVLRTSLPIKSYIQKKIDRVDLEATGRYIYNFEKASEDKTYFDPRYCIIHLDQELAPGGYAWVFPKGENKVNIGLGVQQKALDRHNASSGIHQDVKSLIDNYVRSNPVISKPMIASEEMDNGNGWGTWQVSVRRQNDCLVANGYMIVGDSAWMPKPLDAGGIGPAIIAATIAGKDAVEAIEATDTTEDGLWKYNIDFMNEYGYKTAGLEVFRRMLQTLTNEEINYGMKHFLSKMDIDSITDGQHPEFSSLDMMSMIIRGSFKRLLAENLKYTASMNRTLVEHYRDYPSKPQSFEKWHEVLLDYLGQTYSRFHDVA